MKKTSIFIQARMGSSRLPGKVLMPLGDKALISHHLKRLLHATLAHHRVVVMPETKDNDMLCDFLRKNHPEVDLFFGPEEDVLTRFYRAAESFSSDVIVRTTADCPFIDPSVVDATIRLFQTTSTCSYASNTLHRSFPRGLDVEVFSFSALSEAFHQACDQAEREHVTLYMYRRAEAFTLASLVLPVDYSFLRLTIDERQDLEMARRLYAQLSSDDMREIIAVYYRQPEIFLINQDVHQKSVMLSDEARRAIALIPKHVYS